MIKRDNYHDWGKPQSDLDGIFKSPGMSFLNFLLKYK